MKLTADCVFLAKENEWSQRAATIAKILLGDKVQIVTGASGDPFPEIERRKYSAVLSFLSPWIVSRALLDRAALAINFHPGTADYPGIGCYNFALYEGAEE